MVDCLTEYLQRPNANFNSTHKERNMHIDEAFPSKYLRASDLQGRNVTVKMGRVEQEKIGDDTKLILYFQGKDKGMVLNKTNANNIASIHGGETEDWYGKEITLVEAMVDYQGKSVPAIRIRAPQRKPAPAQQRREMAPAGDFGDERQEPPHRDPISSGRTKRDLDDDIPF
jgi:hypothetical protein